MALKLKIEVAKAPDCSKWTIIPKTGAYDPNSNPTGWGVPNPEIADVTEATITVVYPGGIDPVVIDVTPDLPNLTETGFDITPGLLGLDKLPDGVYKFTYLVRGAKYVGELEFPFLETVFCKTVNLCNVECCVGKAISKIPVLRRDCKTNNHKIEQYLLADVLLDAAHRAGCCGRSKEFECILGELQALCKETNCNC